MTAEMLETLCVKVSPVISAGGGAFLAAAGGNGLGSGAAAGSALSEVWSGGTSFIHPVVLLVLCAVAGVGTALALPGGRKSPLRAVGTVLAVVAGVVLFGLLAGTTTGSANAASASGGVNIYFWPLAAITLLAGFKVITHERPVYSALYFVVSVFATAGLFVLLWAEFMAAALVVIYAGAILVTYVFVIMLASEGGGGVQQRDAGMEMLADCDKLARDRVFASALGFVVMGLLLFVVFDKSTHLTAATDPQFASSVGSFERSLKRIQEAEKAEAVAVEPSAAEQTPAENVVQAAPETAPAAETELSAVQGLGKYLFTTQVLNLQLGGLLLTVSMIGAIMIARRKVDVVVDASAGEDSPAVMTAPMTPTDDNPHSIPVYGTDNPRAKAYPQL